MRPKRCTKCNEEKPLSDYAKDSRARDGMTTRCAPCRSRKGDPSMVQARAKWRSNNQDRIVEYRSQYYADNVDAIKAKNAEYREANREAMRARSREWRQKYPDHARLKDQRRRALVLDAFVENVDVSVVYGRDGGKCYVCGLHIDKTLAFPDGESLSLEHVHPLSRGGEHSYANCAVSHLRCNIRKSASV